ncbi:competence protein ComEC [Paracidovorax cattleyae]|uniref:Competence protein ComEC n=5 Tax=Paracidovorax cattleyae TaxID=80868 RepID=A0A1H0K1N7_9BURK|nr:competence protein ComEC [Paracidovorax cattleyae]
MQPALWPARVYAALLLAGLAVWVPARRLGRRRRGPAAGALRVAAPQWLAFCATALAAFAVCGLRAGACLSDALDPALEGRDLRIVAVVAAMPQPTDAGMRLRLEVESAWFAEQGGGRSRSSGLRPQRSGRKDRPEAEGGAGARNAPGRPVRLPPRVDVSWSSGAPWFARQSGGARGKAGTALPSGDTRGAVPVPPSSPAPASAPVPNIRVGERWEMTVRLNAPHGLRNPGGFDAELWLWEQGVQATGSVQAGARAERPVRLEAAPWWRHPVEQARQRVRDAILARLAPQPAGRADTDPQDLARGRAAGVVAALVTGDQRAIDRADWDVFRATGVAHLVSISGLHITLFAWVAAAVVGWLWRRSALLCLAVPAPWAGLAGGVLLAAAYALFSGWAVPAQRTVCMLAVVGALRLSGRRWPWPQVWLLACAAVVAADPWALLQAGFWLSFVAVGVLFASDAATPPEAVPAARAVGRLRARVLALLREQWVVTLALTPLTVLLFGQVSLVGFVANLAAIPWMTLVVTPLALLGVLWAPLWSAAAACVRPFAEGLQWLAAWPWATVSLPAAPLWAGVAGMAGGVLLVMRLPWALRLMGLPLLLPVLWWHPARPAAGQFELLAPDVGQGSAVLVRTAGHALLYDAGPRYGPQSDAGERVLVPMLRAGGVRLDRVMLSHRDTDHTGGAAAVLAAHPGTDLWGSLEPGHALEAQGARAVTRCEAGQQWTWDGVRFEVLHPPPGALDGGGAGTGISGASADRAGRTNAVSCVLRISAPGASALLAGDIGRVEEAALAASGGLAPADVLLVPHHGSRSSSSPALLDAVRPRTAVVQAGHRNRYGHPAPDVLARYAERGALLVDSPSCGAWSWLSARPLRWRCERDGARRYWHHAPPSAASAAAAVEEAEPF